MFTDITILLLVGIPAIILVFIACGWLWFLGKIFTWVLSAVALIAAIAFAVLAGGAFIWYCWPIAIVLLIIFLIKKFKEKEKK